MMNSETTHAHLVCLHSQLSSLQADTPCEDLIPTHCWSRYEELIWCLRLQTVMVVVVGVLGMGCPWHACMTLLCLQHSSSVEPPAML